MEVAEYFYLYKKKNISTLNRCRKVINRCIKIHQNVICHMSPPMFKGNPCPCVQTYIWPRKSNEFLSFLVRLCDTGELPVCCVLLSGMREAKIGSYVKQNHSQLTSVWWPFYNTRNLHKIIAFFHTLLPLHWGTGNTITELKYLLNPDTTNSHKKLEATKTGCCCA